MRNKGFETTFMSPISKNTTTFCGYAFVDDSDLLQASGANSTLNDPDTTLTDMQKAIDCWEAVAKSTGGAIATDKSWWYVIHFNWKNGQWSYGNLDNVITESLTCKDKDGIRRELKYLPSNQSEEMLGVFLSPDGSNDRQIKKLKTKTKELGELVRTGHLDRHESWTTLTHVAMKSIEYALPALTLSEKECTSIMTPLLSTHLPKSGINRNFPRDILYGPVETQGLGVHNIFLTQGISHICDMVTHSWQTHSMTGDLINTCLEQLRLELGVGGNILSLNYDEYKHVLLTKSWVENTWKFISDYGIMIDLEIATPTPRRINDEPLMELVTKSKLLDKSDLTWFNKCRMFLKIFFVSDIVSSDGTKLRADILDGKPNGKSHSNLLWPKWGKPPATAWSIWRRTLRLIFTNSITLDLKNKLGNWINFEYNTWEWFLSADNSKLYRCQGDQWTRYARASRSIRHNRFRPTCLHCLEPCSTGIFPTTVQVTRASITADPPGQLGITLPNATTSILDSLKPSKFPWLFNTIQRTNDIDQLLGDIQDGKAVAMSDGSYYSDTHITTAAWIIESQDGTQSISGLTIPYFSSTCHGAYRGEIAGLLAITHMVTYLALEHNLSTPSITIGCDNVNALKSSFEFDVKSLNPKHKHADLLSGMAGLLQLKIINIKHQHVYAHQDNNKDYDELPRMAQMNVRMDWLAKFASQQVKNKLIVPPKSSHHPLGFSPVTIHNRTIPHELGKSIYNVIAEKISHQWWLSKGRYNLNDIPLIHWEVCGSASATQSKNNQKFTSKWTTGHLATGRKMALWKKRAMDNCPFCLEPDEHTFHILTCPHAEATKVWDSSLETFIKSLTRLNTETEFLSTLTYDLHCWRNAQPYLLINSISTNLQPIFIHLRQIKYDKFLEGLIPKELIRHQETYFRAQESCLQTGKSWGKKVYKLLWEFTNSIWLGRNQQLHDTDRIKELQGLPLVLQAIQSEYNLGLHRLPPSEFSLLFATSFEILKKRSIDSLRHWLLTIRLGRNIHGGINIIQDIFAHDGPIRSWLGLPSTKNQQ